MKKSKAKNNFRHFKSKNTHKAINILWFYYMEEI